MTAKSNVTHFRGARFMLGAARLAQCPEDVGFEVAFAGRSNAGKSSAINRICDQGKLARSSSSPGRTQQLNFFAIDPEHRLVDLPGYGYARAPESARRAWGRLVESYLQNRRSLAGVVLVMDIRHPLQPQDRQFIDWVAALRIPLHVLLTKADKLKRGAANAALLETRKELERIPESGAQCFSALNGTGLEDARLVLNRLLGLEQPAH